MAFINFLKEIDQSLFLFLNGLHNSFWDMVMMMFTLSETWAPLYLVLILLLLKKYRFKFIFIFVAICLSIVVSDQFSGLVKHTVQRFRPTHEPALQDLVHYVLTKGGKYGFFSSHASNTFALAFLSSKLFRNKAYTITIFVWAAVVTYSRIYVGAHYPIDVLVGAAWGIFTGYVFYKLLLYTETKIARAQAPKISETRLSRDEFYLFLVASAMLVITIMLVMNRLQHFNYLQQ